MISLSGYLWIRCLRRCLMISNTLCVYKLQVPSSSSADTRTSELLLRKTRSSDPKLPDLRLLAANIVQRFLHFS
uniref:Putative secreted protein n=1 Tax=Panstrongylus lignarius TaxID=156445 RepID=A0A224XTT4_9HEMI